MKSKIVEFGAMLHIGEHFTQDLSEQLVDDVARHNLALDAAVNPDLTHPIELDADKAFGLDVILQVEAKAVFKMDDDLRSLRALADLARDAKQLVSALSVAVEDFVRQSEGAIEKARAKALKLAEQMGHQKPRAVVLANTSPIVHQATQFTRQAAGRRTEVAAKQRELEASDIESQIDNAIQQIISGQMAAA